MALDTVKDSSGTGQWMRRFFSHPLVIGLYYLGVLLLAQILNWVKEQHFDPNTMVLAALGSFALVFIVIFISALFFRVGKQAEIDSKIKDLKDFINAQQLGWVVNDHYLRTMEFGSRNTWVFTKTLENDVKVENVNGERRYGELYKAVEHNLAQGNHYVYFLPDTKESRGHIKTYIDEHGFHSGQVRFFLVPDDLFLFYTEVVIYNVSNVSERIAVEWLPRNNLDYYIAMDSDHTQTVVSIGEMYMSGRAREYDVSR